MAYAINKLKYVGKKKSKKKCMKIKFLPYISLIPIVRQKLKSKLLLINLHCPSRQVAIESKQAGTLVTRQEVCQSPMSNIAEVSRTRTETI